MSHNVTRPFGTMHSEFLAISLHLLPCWVNKVCEAEVHARVYGFVQTFAPCLFPALSEFSASGLIKVCYGPRRYLMIEAAICSSLAWKTERLRKAWRMENAERVG